MDRKKFLKNSLLGAAGALVAGTAAAKSDSTFDKLAKGTDFEPGKTAIPTDQVGFNHMPNKEERTMKTVFHKADTRGRANHGWLDANHSFSFANWYNPDRMSFGVLRVLNDDKIAGGGGFPTHPHDNMEIITIPFEGALEHKDSLGNTGIIKHGEVQVMSAGTGIRHSEFNHSADEQVRLFQIWLFPREKSVTPRYDQIELDMKKMDNNLAQILSPNKSDDGVWIHQDAWFHMGNLKAGKKLTYDIKKEGNGVYAMLIDGNVTIEGQPMEKRDGFGLWDTAAINIEATADARLLLLEVPMTL